jgi:hypothetical protein
MACKREQTGRTRRGVQATNEQMRILAANLEGDVMKTLALYALFSAGFAVMKLRRETPSAVDTAGDLRSVARPSAASHRGVFDPLYNGLGANAGRLDAALSRHNARW